MLIVDCSQATSDGDHPPFIHATDFCHVDTILHVTSDLVIDWVQIWDTWMPQVRRNSLVFRGAEGQWLKYFLSQKSSYE